ncbi:MAG: hypothetical protein JST11_25410 [Acidobacteria bacterium]|nr:hypothetical protein [Acidobacteriota bacterium]
MKRLDWKYLPILALFTLSTALAPVFHAQDLSVTSVSTVPADAYYMVDGTSHNGPISAAWPAGSAHTLFAPSPQNPPGQLKTRYVFSGWQFAAGTGLTQNPLVVTASPQITAYTANFVVSYALSLVFVNCPDPANCISPGTISVGGTPVTYSQDIYFGEGSQVALQAFPNPGFVFVGWAGANNQLITGFQNIVTMTGPTEVYPVFQPASKISLSTVPDGLEVLADRAALLTPVTLDWGLNTTHSVGPVSPQVDKFGKTWVFSSWSDGGAANHAYSVGGKQSATITATYIPGAAVTILTQPTGLPLKVDGTSTTLNPLNPYYFTWGVGETHHIEAPAQQTDSQGRVWKFTSWSNGANAAQDFTVPADADTTGGVRLVATYTQMGKLTVTTPLASLTVQVDGADCPTPCQVVRDLGTQVKLSAPASLAQGDGSRLDFNGWPGGGTGDYTATLGATNQTLSAAYHPMNRLSAASDPLNGAAWRISPGSPDGFYSTDAVVNVAVTAQPGYRFRRWDGDLSGTLPSGTVAMSAPRSVRALLDPVPYIPPTGVANAAGSTPSTSVAPGSMISIFGANLTNSTAVAPDGMLPQTLAGMTAHVGDRLLPLVFASPTQVNAVLPSDLAEGAQVLTVSPPAQSDVRAAFTVARNAPGLFSSVFHADGTPVTADSPAQSGEVLTVYGTGFGPTNPPRLDGFPLPSSPDYLVVDSVTARVGDTPATVQKAFAVPGKNGIDAVQFTLSSSTPSGQLVVTVNGVDSNPVTLPVQQ